MHYIPCDDTLTFYDKTGLFTSVIMSKLDYKNDFAKAISAWFAFILSFEQNQL